MDGFLERSGALSTAVKRLSDYSFSLYVIHVPVLFGLISFSTTLLNKDLSGVAGLVALLLILTLVNAAAFLFYWLFERHYRWLYQRIAE